MAELKDMTPEELVKEIEGAREQIKRVNSESAGRRKQLEAFEKEKTDDLSASEKLQAEMKTLKTDHLALQASLSAERVRTAILAKATELGFATPGDAYSLIDLSQVETTDGEVSGFGESLEALAKSGRLTMTDEDQRQSDGLGTPPSSKGKKPVKQDVKQATPNLRI
ncbi:hypothetical protein LCGC14_0561890 [marine sediment metagenome]|uniref:Uncharacterized protein n=1 Tax=marine sediment metagenome TaxID=412755 RepID=A0A0F9S5G2_9ZZZZ